MDRMVAAKGENRGNLVEVLMARNSKLASAGTLVLMVLAVVGFTGCGNSNTNGAPMPTMGQPQSDNGGAEVVPPVIPDRETGRIALYSSMGRTGALHVFAPLTFDGVEVTPNQLCWTGADNSWDTSCSTPVAASEDPDFVRALFGDYVYQPQAVGGAVEGTFYYLDSDGAPHTLDLAALDRSPGNLVQMTQDHGLTIRYPVE